MGTYNKASGAQSFSERQVSAALGIGIFELLLGASELRVGRYDPLTHLFVFTAEDVERIAARRKIPWAEVVRKLTEKRAGHNEAVFEGLPEPDVE